MLLSGAAPLQGSLFSTISALSSAKGAGGSLPSILSFKRGGITAAEGSDQGRLAKPLNLKFYLPRSDFALSEAERVDHLLPQSSLLRISTKI